MEEEIKQKWEWKNYCFRNDRMKQLRENENEYIREIRDDIYYTAFSKIKEFKYL